ncbi:peptidoglycan DD-metalloendopeptidase family protein [Nocardioides sp. R1-1]|uniref:peptidoglycan DD-metalloendopeptidase family protein n=1 Tax=Nocardioides sp. R1-1 TaxID=3383502 RepID=UPI0038CFBD2F
MTRSPLRPTASTVTHLASGRTPSAGRLAALLLALLAGLLTLAAPSTPARAGAGTDPVGVWPLTPRPAVVHPFDPPDSAYGTGHRGVDLAARPSQAVRTALSGRVVFAGRIAGRGVVVVGHGTTRTTYEPVAASVAVGTVLAAGDAVGSLELAGSHCFPQACLHWGWLAGQVYLDPLRLVGAGPVRLLPLWRDLPTPQVRPWGVPAGRPGAAGRW